VFSGDFFDLALQVIRSWQVIMVTVALVLYIFMINYVANVYNKRRPRPSKPKKGDIMAEPEEAAGEDISAAASDNDELGLEEE
jgi:hypothetical protein